MLIDTIVEKKVVFIFTFENNSLVYATKKSGLSTEPCRTSISFPNILPFGFSARVIMLSVY